ncbi:exodeoxyribonuclease VII large subunit [Wielerella bovis]|uniref:exodeoxyribonuclease VII large subunit n=1 Tax=Wielerella bovis TaxID=2917790 RepID=UPI0020198602|nr:exodeoxyribonuclease VII large subunit [Wielerella bovis]MCG7657335.1 exodeoxyribonuclease VII large subunit [Wielerella bovis]MCG7659557.1 exodeoxyribonuclease VII large subunit [Wielerella bovis]
MQSDLFAPAALSVSELNAIAAELLDSQLSSFWISGEISNLTRAASGHYYFSLKDDRAQVRCAMFKHAAMRLDTPLREGDHVEVCGKISLYEARGEFQINVNEVRQIGLGQLFARYERLKKQLQAEGIFAPENKQMLPENPRSIGIVSSLAAAALRDVLTTLRRRAPHIPVIVYPTPVQGSGSEQHIAQAIEIANQRTEVDVLIVCRGGGSIEDLWAFNEEVVVRAIAASHLPIVSGVGHETDFTLSDFVADVRAPTPTGAAELVSPNIADMLDKLDDIRTRLRDNLQRQYQNAAQNVDFLARQLQHPKQKYHLQRTQLTQATQLLRHAMRQQMQQQQHRLARCETAVQHAKPDVEKATQRVAYFQAALRTAQQNYLSGSLKKVAQQAELLEALSPHTVLQRGFAIVRNTRGQVVRDADSLRKGQKLNLQLAHGATDVVVAAEQMQTDLFE